MKEKNKLYPFFCHGNPWSHNSNTIWIASTLSFKRNLEKFKFAAKLTMDRQKQIISLIDKELLSIKDVKAPSLIKAEDLVPLEKEYLLEHFLLFHSFQQAHSGEAFIVDESGEFFVGLNLKDHIHLQLIDCGEDLENTWNRLVKIETELGKSINFSFSPKFGFLTADPTECGTGFIASVFLHLPALIHLGGLKEIQKVKKDNSLKLTGLQGSPDELIGDVLVVTNNYTLGLTEENILSIIRGFVTKLVIRERSIRNQLQHGDNEEFKDKVSRAYGVLTHSYRLEAIEALNAISMLKLGANLGWVKGLTMPQLNKAFFTIRRAHLLCEFEAQLSQEELPHKRAEYIHKIIKSAQLTI